MCPKNKRQTDSIETPPDDCFAENTKKWIWLLGAAVAGTMTFGIAMLINTPVSSTVPQTNTTPAQTPVMERSVPIQSLAMEINTIPNPRRVIVHSVYGWGPARGADIQVGDRIYRFNGQRVRNIDQFKSLVAKATTSTEGKLEVIRNGKRIRSIIRIEPGK